jgi:hypothetical protein
MIKLGPFWMQRPTASVSTQTFGECFIYIGRDGRFVAQVWVS